MMLEAIERKVTQICIQGAIDSMERDLRVKGYLNQDDVEHVKQILNGHWEGFETKERVKNESL